MPYVHRVSSDRYCPFYVCVMSDEPPGEVVYAHPDEDREVVIPDGAPWRLVVEIPAGAVRGHPTTPASVVRAKAGATEIPAGKTGSGAR